jgi:hypothetical protein
MQYEHTDLESAMTDALLILARLVAERATEETARNEALSVLEDINATDEYFTIPWLVDRLQQMSIDFECCKGKK